MFGLGKSKPPVDVRAMLADAARDFGGETLAARAIHFFDNRKAFEEWGDHSSEPPWISDNYEPEPAEVAADILFQVLREDRRIQMIDWATGAAGAMETFDSLLSRAGAPPLDPTHKAAVLIQVEGDERGGAMVGLTYPLSKEAEARGLACHWWDLGQDAYFLHVLKPDALKRWRDARFGKDYPVLP